VAALAVVPNVVLSNVYDSVGNRLSLSDTINAQAMGTTAFGYDVLQRLTQVTQTGTGVSNKRADFAYAVSQITGINRYASVDVSVPVVNSAHTYDAASRLTRMLHQQGANVISNQAWVYDAVARITQFASTDGTSAYTYDNTDQVTAVDHSYQTDEAYLYDANGNRRNTGYATTTNNRLQSAAGYTYTYDNEGNRLKRTKTTEVTDYTWDYRNRLTKVETKSGTTVTKSASYIYDVFDRRIGRSMYPDGLPTIPPVAERRFVYDRDHILLSFDNNNNLTHRYMHGPVLDMVLADDSNGNILWTLADNLGTVRDVVDSSGVVRSHRKYDSFGNITSQTNVASATRFSYTGREFDADTGLYFYRSCYYDPLVGRFIREDVIGFGAGDTNLYRYVGNSPVNAIDPSGKDLQIPWKENYKWPKDCQLLDMVRNPITGRVVCRYICKPWGPKDTISRSLDDPNKKCPQWFDYVPDPVPGEPVDKKRGKKRGKKKVCVMPAQPEVFAPPNYSSRPTSSPSTTFVPSPPPPKPWFPNIPDIPPPEIPPIPCFFPFCNPFDWSRA
jgi:RHS repeat-associated protein